MMKNRLVLVVVLACVLGSVAVSSMDFSYTFKSIFNGIALTVLAVIGLVSLYTYFKKGKV